MLMEIHWAHGKPCQARWMCKGSSPGQRWGYLDVPWCAMIAMIGKNIAKKSRNTELEARWHEDLEVPSKLRRRDKMNMQDISIHIGTYQDMMKTVKSWHEIEPLESAFPDWSQIPRYDEWVFISSVSLRCSVSLQERICPSTNGSALGGVVPRLLRSAPMWCNSLWNWMNWLFQRGLTVRVWSCQLLGCFLK